MASALAGVLLLVSGEVIPQRQFEAPFSNFDGRGTRYVPGWKVGGRAQANMSVLRLTSDKGDEHGSLWATRSPNPKPESEFSLEVRLRVSGYGPNTGGSFNMFMTDVESAREGSSEMVASSSTNYVGLALQVRTMRDEDDADRRAGPQKLELFANYKVGEKPVSLGSCYIAMQYDESRDDFTPFLASSLRVTYADDKVTVEVDPRASSRWRRCTHAQVPLSSFDSSAWLHDFRVGLAGQTTGKQHANIDVMSLRAYSAASESYEADLREEDRGLPQTVDRALLIAHRFEHELIEVQDTIQAIVARLKSAQDLSTERLLKLEDMVHDAAKGKMEERIDGIETTIRDKAMPELEKRFERAQTRTETRLHDRISSKGPSGSWRIPFFGIMVMFGAAAYVANQKLKGTDVHNAYKGLL